MTLVSLKYGFIFIKTTKTAGTSIEIDLSNRMDHQDIVTEIFPSSTLHTPRHFKHENGLYYNHMPATEIRSLVGEEFFNRAHKFCVEREPVAKCISYFHMLRNSKLHNGGGRYKKTWSQFVEDRKFPVDLDKYSEVNEGNRLPLVDTILDYNSLETTLPELLHEFGIDNFKLRSRAKSEYSKSQIIRREQVSPSEASTILETFAEAENFKKNFNLMHSPHKKVD